jgi:hypothetical protein
MEERVIAKRNIAIVLQNILEIIAKLQQVSIDLCLKNVAKERKRGDLEKRPCIDTFRRIFVYKLVHRLQ